MNSKYDNMSIEELEAIGREKAERYRVLRQARRAKTRKEKMDAMLAEHPELAPDPNAPIEYKVCSMCGENKPLSEYRIMQTKAGPRYWRYCKKCNSLVATQKNLERYLREEEQLKQGKEYREALELEQEGKKKCKICMCIKPLDEFPRDVRIVKRTGKIRHDSICTKCHAILATPGAVAPNEIRGKTTPTVPPIIMNPKKPNLAIIDKFWLLDPADEEHWQLDPRVKELVQELIHLPLTSNEKPKLDAAPKYEELPEGQKELPEGPTNK